MNNLKLFYFIFVIYLVFTTACNNAPKSNEYTIVHTEKEESKDKAQLTEYAVYNGSSYNADSLKKILQLIYDESSKKGVFKNFSTANYFVAYLYATKKDYLDNKFNWIGMLKMRGKNSEAELSINYFNLSGIRAINVPDSEERRELDSLISYLKQRDVELCTLYNYLLRFEDDAMHEANYKYPDFSTSDHDLYFNNKIKEEHLRLQKEHGIADSVFSKVNIWGVFYCK